MPDDEIYTITINGLDIRVQKIPGTNRLKVVSDG